MIEMAAKERVRIAGELGVHEQYLYQCLTGRRRIPEQRAPFVERAAAGAVTCEQLRPDVCWVRVPDPAWPHPQGRPCIDVAANPPPAEPLAA